MGCASSTEVVTDPITGQERVKKQLGGAYPGQRRPQHSPYMPPASDFGKDGAAMATFVSYGGGNALSLVQPNGSIQPQQGKPDQYIQVTLPPGVSAGQTIHVQAPDGRMNAIQVPPGFGPGSTFVVQFADTPPPPVFKESQVPYQPPPSGTSSSASPAATHFKPTASSNNGADDGFVSGFQNPHHWQPSPSAQQTPSMADAQFHSSNNYNSFQQYPTASATPVYPEPKYDVSTY